MAGFAIEGLNPGAENSKGGPFISSYTTADAIAVIEGANYFDPAAAQLRNSISFGFLVIFDTTNSLCHLRAYTVSAADVVALVDPTIT